MFGLGKERTQLGRWLDRRGITQQWLTKKSGLNKATVSDLCTNNERTPSGTTMKKILKALREIDQNIRQDDFWDI